MIQKNTFQLAIATNGTESFCFFLYPENGIQWHQGKRDVNAHPIAFARAGLLSRDARHYKLPGSGTEQVKNYPLYVFFFEVTRF